MDVLTPSAKRSVSFGSVDSFSGSQTSRFTESRSKGARSQGLWSRGATSMGAQSQSAQSLPFKRYSDSMKKTAGTVRGRGNAERTIGESTTKVWKVILITVLLGVAGVGYIHHGYQMQAQLDRVQVLELELEKTRRIHQEKKLELDRATGPKEIYSRAQQLGFVSPGPADRIIHLE